MRIAYLVARYPAVSQTFVLGEVRGVRAAGLEVDTMAIRRSPPEEVLSQADREADATTFAVRPIGPARLLRAHARALARAPLAYLRTLAHALALGRADLRALLWQLFYFGQAIVVWERCRERGIRHLHVHFPNVAADVALLVARYGGAGWGFSLTVHGPSELADVRGHRLADKVRAARLTICISDYTRSQLMSLVEPEHWGRLAVAHCGIDVERFAPAPAGGRAGAPTVLAVGRLDPRKAHRLLVEALGELTARGVDVRVAIVGEGPERPALERRARELGVADRLELPGAVGQDEIVAWFRRADVLCLPSLAEGLPVVLMEAMACQVPVVAPRMMGIPELVEDGVTGTLVAPGRADALAEAIERLLADPADARRLAAAGRARVRAEFEVGACSRRVAELLREAAGGG